MDTLISVCVFAFVIFVVSVLFQKIPLYFTGDEKHMHRILAVSAGLMMGLVFIMLIPDAFTEGRVQGHSDYITVAFIIIGFVFAFLFTRLIMGEHEYDHKAASHGAFLGLCIHSVFDGVGIAAGFLAGKEIGLMILVAMCIHKCAEVFSLSSTMVRQMGKEGAWKYMVVYSAVTPVAQVAAYLLMSGMESVIGPALAFSAGILLFIVLCDMLPEQFQEMEGDTFAKRTVSLAGGFVIAVAVAVQILQLTGGQGIRGCPAVSVPQPGCPDSIVAAAKIVFKKRIKHVMQQHVS